ncbi:protein of unknown function [Petrocella atlantisensis]|uniref:Uncharacterized protein n=1 Tax=Petrocella atlantisensis TaxID=2173034 RepID=A0A3P7RWC7_9FIRM|nr:protein of unknown function [Petrocella atlantisensis]
MTTWPFNRMDVTSSTHRTLGDIINLLKEEEDVYIITGVIFRNICFNNLVGLYFTKEGNRTREDT